MKYFACEGDFHMHENENKTCFELLESYPVARKLRINQKWISYESFMSYS